MIEKTTNFILLYDFYQELLTDKQKEYAELYFQDDFSLGEIAEQFGISRQAVYDNIKRTEKILEEYERKLQLLEKFALKNKIIEDIELILKTDKSEINNKIKDKITLLKRLE